MKYFLVGKTEARMSMKDSRYCVECQPFLEHEYSLISERTGRKSSKYNPVPYQIAHGMVKTQRSRPSWGNSEALKQIVASVPLGRIGEPSEIAGVALFLAFGVFSYITGHTIVADGGTLA